jgi:chromosome segregation ATPase
MHAIKTYIKKVKLINPVTSFKNWLLTDLMIETERLDHRVDRLENQTSIDDVDNRVDNLEYDLESRIESVEDRSETNQESIKILKDKFNVLKHNIESDKENLFDIEADIKTIKKVDFEGIADRFDKIDDRVDNLEEENVLNSSLGDRVDNLEELAKKYLNAELEAVALKQERSEQSLSDIQRLAFEICHYYGGEFDVNDFDNCYEIISKYNVVWKRNPQPKKTNKKGGK